MQNKTTTPNVSKAVIGRLPRYYRYLRELISEDVLRISSGELAKLMNVSASQIRQDLGYFGGFGQQGYGYNVKDLYKAIGDILGMNDSYSAILIGAGNLGKALATGTTFVGRGVRLRGIFDNDPRKVGSQVGEISVLPMSALEGCCREWKPTIAVLAVPRTAAKEVAATLIPWGIQGIWNFSGEELIPGVDVPSDLAVENVQLGDLLMTLCYEIHAKEQNESNETDEN
jgi:redox-sensing transcriptional repressor